MIETSSLHISPEMLSLVAAIDEFKGAWQVLGTIAPDRLKALRRVATIESVGSSTRIEGSRLSDLEVERLLSRLEIKAFATRDEQEVAGYAEVMELVFAAWPEISITENHIRQLHRDLLRYSNKDEGHRGNYKISPNNVVAVNADGIEIGVVFETASPFDTPRLMTELVQWLDTQDHSRSLHRLIAIGIFIVVFLEIHPFQDGNGRLSRILTTLLLLRAGYAYVPYASLESIVEETKEDYYLALRRTQGTIRSTAPDWSPWLLYFLRALHQQVRRLRSKMEREALLATKLPALSLLLLDHARAHGRITMSEAVTLTGSSRNTLKTHFRSLVERRLLALHGSGRGAWYSVS